MKSWQRRAFATVSATVVSTGTVYFWMKYWLVSDDPFAVVNHPLQPMVLDAHVLAGPAFVLLFGILFNAHVAWALRAPVPLRRSGLTSLVAIVVMIASGYVLQVVTNEQAQRITVVTHLASGAVFTAAYTTHVVAAWRRWRQWSRAVAARG